MWTSGGQIDHITFAGLRGGGGKGAKAAAPPPTPPPTYTDPTTGATYTSTADQNAAIAADQLNAATIAAANKADAATIAAQNESTFQGNRQQAYNDAMNSVLQTFRGQGVDPNKYMNYITPTMQQAYNSVPDLSTNISSFFPTSMGQTILNQATGDQRTQLMNQLNQTFNPTYSSTALPTNIMDPAVSSILSNQFDPLSAQLTNAQKRGTLTDLGYQAAVNKMNQDRAAAQSQLQSLGQNILTTDRGALDTLASGARSDIANMSLGQNIDPTQYVNQANQLTAQDVSGFPGALQSAAGNVTFADIQDLLNAGGVVQGATNPTAANPVGAAGAAGSPGAIGGGGVAPGQQLPSDQAQTGNRGLGTTGAF